MLNDLVVKILTPKDPTYSFYNSDATCRPYTSEGDGCILIRLPEEGRTWSDIDLVVQTEKFLKDNAGQRPNRQPCSQKKRVKTATGKNYSVFSWNHYLQKQMSGRLASAYRKIFHTIEHCR